MIDPLFSHIAILFMAALFFIASVHKLWNINRFQTSSGIRIFHVGECSCFEALFYLKQTIANITGNASCTNQKCEMNIEEPQHGNPGSPLTTTNP